MAKRPETRAAAAKTSAGRRPAPRPSASAANKPTKAAGAAESAKAEVAKRKRAVGKTRPTKTATAETATTKPVKSAKAKSAPRAKAPAKTASTKAAAQAKPANSNAKRSAAKTSKAKAKAASKPEMPHFLAAELGHPVDHDGEPIGAGSRAALGDIELQRYTLQLWRQMQSRRGVNTHIPAMERAGVTIDQIWTAGVTDRLTTSSTPDEVKRYRQKLLFRANLLESIMIETIDELQRLGTIDPTPPPGEPG